MTITCAFRDTPAEVAQSASTFIAAQINSAIKNTDECLVALAGGATPAPIYRLLRDLDIDWGKVSFVQTDERLIQEAGDRSAPLIAAMLGLDHPDHAAHWYPVQVGSDGARTAAMYAEQLGAIRSDGVPDIAVLGLGTDGHTASIFSHNVHSDSAATVICTEYRGEVRVSLGLDYLRTIPARVLLATGASKRAALASVLSPSADRDLVPAAVVLGRDGYVFADAAACPEGARDAGGA